MKLSDEERKAKKKAYDKVYHAKNAVKRRAQTNAAKMKRCYGITYEEKDALLASQGFVCAICKSDTPTTKQGWVVDHCHQSGEVRGILCGHCNVMLGHARDNVDILSNAIKYLN